MGCLLHNFKKNDRKEGKVKDGGMLGPGDVASMNEMVVHRGPDLVDGEVRHVMFLLSAPNECSSFYHYNTQFSAPVFFGQILLTSWEHLKGKKEVKLELLRILAEMVITSYDPINECKRALDDDFKDLWTSSFILSLFEKNRNGYKVKSKSKVFNQKKMPKSFKSCILKKHEHLLD